MGEAFLDYKKGGVGLDINGLITDYYVYAGSKVSAGDFVEFINGIADERTETSVDTVISSKQYAGWDIKSCKLTANKVFIVFSDGGDGSSDSYMFGIVCTIEGGTIICGAETQLSANSASGGNFAVEALSENKVFIVYRYDMTNRYLYGMVCTISGTTITAGADTSIVSTSYAGQYELTLTLVGQNKVLVTHGYNTSNRYLYGVVCTISGTTITKGTDTAICTSAVHSAISQSVTLLTSGKVFISHPRDKSSYYLNGLVCTISGTTITAGATKQISTAVYTGRCSSAVALSEDKVFIAHTYTDNFYFYGVVCTISGTDITVGTDTMIREETYASRQTSTVLLSNGDVLTVHSLGTGYSLYGIISRISGTTITNFSDTRMVNTIYSGFAISTILLESDKVFVAHCYNSNYNLHGQIWDVDETNNIPINQVTDIEYETQVRKTTKVPCAGVAKTSGTGGDVTSHNQKIQIYCHPENLLSRDWSTVSSTEYATDDIILTADSFSGATGDVLKYACDGDTSTYWASANGINHWITAEFKNSIKPLEMKLQIGNNSYFSNAIIQGGQNNVNWNTLYTINTNLLGGLTTISLASVKSYYKYLRIYFTMTQSAQAFVYEWQITKYVF